MARYLGIPLSGDTVLRELRNAPRAPFEEPKVVGVDDWALRRGQDYGTLIVDLERHLPLALLPGRSAEVLSDWLAQHPGIEVISRDRAECYARGAAIGAPEATQVADRWHLRHNLREALKNASERYVPEIRKAVQEVAAMAVATPPAPTMTTPVASEAIATVPTVSKPLRGNSKRETRRARRVERNSVCLHSVSWAERHSRPSRQDDRRRRNATEGSTSVHSNQDHIPRKEHD